MTRSINDLRWNYEIAARRLQIELIALSLIEIKAGFRHGQPINSLGQWTNIDGNVKISRRDKTGNRRIDWTSDTLVDLAVDIIKERGSGSSPAYGVAIHTRFAETIKALDLPGIGSFGVEQSFSAGDVARYGLEGSVRTDIVPRDGRTGAAPIIAVWDLKTGTARLNPKRVEEIRDELNIDESVPVIEIHVDRGLKIKTFAWLEIC